MKRLATIIVVSIIAACTVSCRKSLVGEGPTVSQIRATPAFNGIELQMYGDVYYKNEPERKLEIIAQQNILNNIETYVSGNKLIIKFNNSRDFWDADMIRINVSAPDANSFVVNSAGNINCMNDINTQLLYLRNGGSGSISLSHINANIIDAENNGSGSIQGAVGTSVSEHIKNSGSGQINFSGVTAHTANAETIGSGSVRVKVLDHLRAVIDGTGSIYYSGNPTVSSDISGQGHLIHF